MDDKRTEYISLCVTREDKKRIEDAKDNHNQQLEIINDIFTREKKWKKGELRLSITSFTVDLSVNNL